MQQWKGAGKGKNTAPTAHQGALGKGRGKGKMVPSLVGSTLESTAAAHAKGNLKAPRPPSQPPAQLLAGAAAESSGGASPKKLGISSKAKAPARPKRVAPPKRTPATFDLDALFNEIYNLENLEPKDWKQGTTEVYNRIMTDESLAECLNGAGGSKAQQQLSDSIEYSFQHFQPWQQPVLLQRLAELYATVGSEDSAGCKNTVGKGSQKGWKASKGSKGSKAKKGTNDATTSARTTKESQWKHKLKNSKWAAGKKDATGANQIEVAWKPPSPKEEDEKNNDIPAMSAGPPVANQGPAGRGRGTSLPAWMTSGVGATSTAAIDTAAPQLAKEAAQKKPEKDLLAETFKERDKGKAERLTAQFKPKWTGGAKKKKAW